ncbi:MAG: CPBP family intramembrane glutamic endopeptidase [Phycisphaeraceae bacterium]
MYPRSDRTRACLALLLLVPAPSLGVYLMTFGGGGSLGQLFWGIGKFWLLGFPLAWFLLVERGRISIARPRREGMMLGVLSGLVIGAAMLAAFFLFAQNWIDAAVVRQRIEHAGFATPTKMLLLTIYTCLINALLEEYVWRWFVYRQCESVVGITGAASSSDDGPSPLIAAGSAPQLPRQGLLSVLLAAFLFTLHHVIALAFYFDWRIVLLATTGVFTGGLVWSWFYLRYRNIWPGYISHVLADVAIFIMAWIIVFG